MTNSNKYHYLFVTVLFFVYLINGLIYIPQQSITDDEGNHLNYAIRFVKGHPEKIKPFDDASTMPVSSLNMLPRITEQLLHPGLQKTDWGYGDILHGRYITLFISLLIGLYVYLWSKDLFGKKTSVFSLLLFVFCPNISAHAGLLTTDVYSALFTIAPLYHFWKYSLQGSLRQFILFAVAIALAQLSKQSLTFLYILFLLLLVIVTVNKKSLRVVFSKTALKNLALFILIQLFILNAGFQFQETGKPLNAYSFKSHFFQTIQSRLQFLGDIPLIVPSPYINGLDFTKTIDEIGPGHVISPKAYLLGESRKGRGFWNYYFVVLFFKIPLSLLFTFLISIFLFFRYRVIKGSAAAMLLLPIAFFLIYFNFFYKSQCGIRHILMILPLMHVFAGIFFYETVKGKKGMILGALIAIYSMTTYYYYFPYLIPYTNEFILNKKMTYKKIADSNLDYNQATGVLKKYLEMHPNGYAPNYPAAGTFIISVSDLLGTKEENGYSWLRENYKPSKHLAFTYLIFIVSKESLAEKKLLYQ